MPSDFIIIKNHLHLFKLNDQIDIINNEIDRLEKIKKEQVLFNELIKSSIVNKINSFVNF